jgi:hypothetical protein
MIENRANIIAQKRQSKMIKPVMSPAFIVEDRPNFQSLSDINIVEEIRRANGSSSAMASFYNSSKGSNK